jgi:protein-S-isoprenylcysteine O-methyltransferase Ste14
MMLGLYLPSPLGTLAFTICFYGWAIFELVVNLRFWKSGSQNRDRFSRYLIIGGMLVGFTLAVLAASFIHVLDITAYRPQVFYLGLALMVGGLVFRFIAIRQLGAFFVPEVVIQPGQRVFQGGLYRTLRHPSYTGTLVTVIGYGLALTNWLSLLTMLIVFFTIYTVRMNVEEAALLEAFGDEYRTYLHRTKRIIPFVY